MIIQSLENIVYKQALFILKRAEIIITKPA
jgi:hypothetical protein